MFMNEKLTRVCIYEVDCVDRYHNNRIFLFEVKDDEADFCDVEEKSVQLAVRRINKVFGSSGADCELGPHLRASQSLPLYTHILPK